jgi:hypothetical protein
MEKYKGLIIGSKSKQFWISKLGESSIKEKERNPVMGDKDENPDDHEERHERHKFPQRRDRNSPLNLLGEQNQLPTLPQGALPVFLGDRAVYPKRHMNLFLDMCEFHLI